MKLANRLEKIAPFHVMDLLAKAKSMSAAGRDIIHLEVGEPDFSSPEAVIQGAKQALDAGYTHYTAALGLPELRQAISQYYDDRYGETVSANRIVITSGASGALQLAVSALVNEGENLLLTDPGYPCNQHFLANIGAYGKAIKTHPENGFHMTPLDVQTHWDEHTRGVLVASPANPTGNLMDPLLMAELHDRVVEQGGVFIMDEIYHGLTYGEDAVTAVNLSDHVVVINSFSKYFGMTGWRLGWMVLPENMVSAVDKLAQNLFLAPSTPAQYGALAAFKPECIQELERRRQVFNERREYLLGAVSALGFDVEADPNGAFYLYANISRLNHVLAHDSMAFCLNLLEETGVAITPGIDFSNDRGHEYVRFAYTADIPVLKQAIQRIQQFLQHG